MLPPASSSKFTNLADPVFRLTMMRDCIREVQAPGDLWYPLLNLISTFIDGLASGPKGGTRAAYVRYLKAHFPDLCSAVGAETFYERYRNAAVHEFSLKAGYAIGRDSGLKGAYTDTQLISDTGETTTLLTSIASCPIFFPTWRVCLLGQRRGRHPKNCNRSSFSCPPLALPWVFRYFRARCG